MECIVVAHLSMENRFFVVVVCLSTANTLQYEDRTDNSIQPKNQIQNFIQIILNIGSLFYLIELLVNSNQS